MRRWVCGQIVVCGMAVCLVRAADEPDIIPPVAPPSADTKLEYEEPVFLTGEVFGPGAGKRQPLFKFRREATRTGEMLHVRRDFTYPDGRPAAQERVLYQGNNLVSYDLKELQTGAEGQARIQRDPANPARGSIEFQYTAQAGRKPKTRRETFTEAPLINDMVAPFLISHWESLLQGAKIKCRYIVIPRRETVGFTFAKDSESTWQGRPVVVIRMEATSPFVATIVNPMFLTIEQNPPHHVLQYVGRTTPKISIGGKWKDLDSVTVFDWSSSR